LREYLSRLSKDKQVELAGALTMLDSRLGALIMTQGITKISDMSREQVEALLSGFYGSFLQKFRGLPRGIVALILAVYVRYTDMSFVGYDDGELTRNKPIVNKQPEYEFLSVGANASEIFTDVLVIGSGSGGGVAAATLAQAGKRVLVVEKSHAYKQEEFPMKETDAQRMYENNGVMSTDDGFMTVLAGSTFGGGSTVNWSASLQTPALVRKEWAQKTGYGWYETAEFQDSLDFVCNRMGVSADHIQQNFPNRKLLEGSKKLGHVAYAVPQNTGGSSHYCGHCPHGCRGGDKKGGLITWLSDAKDSGAQFLQDTFVKKIIIEHGVAKGALVTHNGRDLTIRAERVVLAAGTLNTPCILKASGMHDPEIGRGLKLHPCSFITAHFEDEETRPHEGGILTSVSLAAFNGDGSGHGAYLEVVSNQPGLHSALLPWHSGKEWKKNWLKYPHATSYIALTRDRDSGYVYPDPVSGKPTVHYQPSAYDRKSMLEGVVKLCDTLLAAGADELHTAQEDVPSFRPVKNSPLGIKEPSYVAWIARVRKAGMVPGRTAMGSAHQMGTCSMGRVTDADCKVKGVQGLYIADASVFPTCSGVNPMITTMAVAHRTAKRIIAEDEKSKALLHKEFSAKL
jgi:choline dehydrogenase-like flavoprotein